MRNKGTNIKLTVKNLTVSYNDEGPNGAPVIILIHGFPFNKSMWNDQMEMLTENFRVIAYDVRGFGNSEAETNDFSIELFVSDLLNLMDALKIEKAMLCGLSMGGYIALNAIENFPKRFSALILCDTNCVADTPEAANESIKNLFAPISFVTNQEKIAVIKEMIMKASVRSLSATLLALTKRKETCNKLGEIKVPVLIMVGEDDKVTPPVVAKQMHKNIKGSILNVIENAGHLSNIENSYDFNIHLEKFVSSVRSK